MSNTQREDIERIKRLSKAVTAQATRAYTHARDDLMGKATPRPNRAARRKETTP